MKKIFSMMRPIDTWLLQKLEEWKQSENFQQLNQSIQQWDPKQKEILSLSVLYTSLLLPIILFFFFLWQWHSGIKLQSQLEAVEEHLQQIDITQSQTQTLMRQLNTQQGPMPTQDTDFKAQLKQQLGLDLDQKISFEGQGDVVLSVGGAMSQGTLRLTEISTSELAKILTLAQEQWSARPTFIDLTRSSKSLLSGDIQLEALTSSHTTGGDNSNYE